MAKSSSAKVMAKGETVDATTAKRSLRRRSVSEIPPTSHVGLRAALPTHAEIAQRAFEIWLSRGGEHGRHDDDWAQAEQELTSR